jgi:indolepyruvate ferredoxin oxidoreductase
VNKVGSARPTLTWRSTLAAGTRVNLERCDPVRTVAVVNASILPSGEMVRNVDFTPPVDGIRGQIDRFTRAAANVAVEARRLSEVLFGDYMATNMLVLGVAYQAGLLPLTGGPSSRPSA